MGKWQIFPSRKYEDTDLFYFAAYLFQSKIPPLGKNRFNFSDFTISQINFGVLFIETGYVKFVECIVR